MSAPDLGYVHHVEPGDGPLTLLLLHGTGGNEQSLVALARDLAPGIRLLSPRGDVLEGDQPRFFRRLSPGVFDVDDLARRADALARFVGAAADAYGFDPLRVVALGYSNGAVTAAALLLVQPRLLAGAVLFRPMVPLQPRVLPDLTGVPVVIYAGQHDDQCPPEQVNALAELLRAARADVALHWQDAGHKITRTELDAARGWLAELARAGDAPPHAS